MELKEWAERVITNVSQSGECAEVIRLLSTDGVAWETWWRNQFGKPEDWADEAMSRVAELAEDWPPQEVQLLFVAENAQGTVLSQCTKRVRGRAKGASANVFGGPGKAMADGMDAIARTMDRVLATANGQMDHLSNALQLANQTNVALTQALQVERLRAEEAKPAVDPELINQGVALLPQLFEMFMTQMNGKPPTPTG